MLRPKFVNNYVNITKNIKLTLTGHSNKLNSLGIG